MAIESHIRWRRGDNVTLGRAVAEFNRKIKRLEQEETDVMLPAKVSFQEIKNKVYSRKELNRIVASLRRFREEGAEDLYTTTAGEKITLWEQQEIQRQANYAIRKMKQELKELNKPTESGFSYAQMGVSRVKELERMIGKIEKIDTATEKKDIEKARNLAKAIGTADYDTKKAIIYRQNYMTMYEKTYGNYKNYKKFKQKLDSLQDPKAFWNYLKTNDKLRDIDFMYEVGGVGIVGVNGEKAFDELLESIGIKIDTRDVKGKKTGNYEISENNTYKIR